LDHQLECIACKSIYEPSKVSYTCNKCGDLLNIRYEYDYVRNLLDSSLWYSKDISVWKYADLLPVNDFSRKISLGEGGTGLHNCNRLGRYLRVQNLFVKNEGENPTGSFKDRGMTVGVTKAVEFGVKKVICASTGNTSASLAAYAAKAGIECIVLIPSGKIALGKLSQAMIHGTKVIQIEGNFDEALKIVIKLAELKEQLYLLNSINPYRIEGQKTLSYEVWNQLKNSVPDVVIVPVGNAANISAIWKGFTELEQLGFISDLPRMIGIQAEGAAPIFKAFKKGSMDIIPIKDPNTIASAIRIGSPASWKKALMSVKDSNGLIEAVNDEEIIESQKILAKMEGLFIEPASAASIAGLKKLTESGEIDKNEKIICVATGHGLKDPNIVKNIVDRPMTSSKNLDDILQAISS
jgi:threonine synthase